MCFRLFDKKVISKGHYHTEFGHNEAKLDEVASLIREMHLEHHDVEIR